MLYHLNFGGERGDIECFQKLYFTIHFRVFSFYSLHYTGDMPEPATRSYNLRSEEEVVELPLQLRLLDDIRFMSDLLTSKRTHTGQVSDSECSIKE